MNSSSRLRLSAFSAGRTALLIFAGVFAMALIHPVLDGASTRNWTVNWRAALVPAAVFGCGSFLLFFAVIFFRLRSDETVERALDEECLPGERLADALRGFVAMEYYDLILNRTYVVFVAPDGLYGWKAHGPVDASNPRFFTPYQQMLEDEDLMKNLNAIRKLAKLKGGFFIPRSQLIGAEFVDKKKWGMGPIPHSGRLKIRMASGGSREFVLLGNVSGDAVRKTVLGGAAPAPEMTSSAHKS